MRIAYICADPGVPVFGSKGASVHIQEVVRALRRAGHHVTVYAVRRGNLVPADLTDLHVHIVRIDAADAAARERAQAEAATLLSEQVRADGADLVYERYSLFSTALATLADAGIPGVLEVNSPLIDEQRHHRELVDEAGALAALRAQVRAARTIVCVSEPVRRWVCGHADAPRAVTIPNGVNLQRLTPAPEDPDRVIVTFVGTLKPWHGVADLLRAAALARQEWGLRIIGDGPELASLRALAEELGLDVDFRGALAPQDVPAALAGTAIGVAPYPDLGGQDEQYFSPLKVLEYLAAGLPVVASAVGQLPRLLDGIGVLVPPSDPAALAAALDALAVAPQLRARRGELGRRRAEKHHGWDAVVAQILAQAEVQHV
ncbi:MAG: glycosyltransferase family 4 protein [Actinomyces ruminicola]|uniref:Glycosyltransferase involved in cell wall bisynthesis n=1 Tax=Actinomyces ruminicola TaxID=332524 RepID=A0A1G9WBP4_9ACTO|nr:glycosyltransferase family 4 protein [Actinomyces ruminicola]MBE6481339.1 glycosyltransferase family 4 protein [Actinomyces ruminicola]SDM81932.1 Glycosyltransferase involved in cell wall bisynthesis [Actinomyces ruminicola]